MTAAIPDDVIHRSRDQSILVGDDVDALFRFLVEVLAAEHEATRRVGDVGVRLTVP